jgi:dual specificity tyrosine-phosphorylation-regulated kinase 2/3/4
MLRCLLFLRKQRVVHCDLKPENILLVHPLKSEIKVIDFGSSCFENEKGLYHPRSILMAVYTYIQSRFYRSPEVILGMNYGMAIDMWSVGCILAELYTGYPLFPGENEQEQLACIMEVFGPPEKYLVEKSARKKLFFDTNGKPKPVVSSKGKRRRPSTKTLAQSLNCGDDAFVDFITRCMRWSPDARMTPEEALQHPFIDETVPKVMERRTSSQVKSMLPTPAATFGGRTKSMAENLTIDRRNNRNTTATMSVSSSLPTFSQSQSSYAPRPLPEVPKVSSSTSMKRSHRLSNSISAIAESSRPRESTTKSDAPRAGLGIFTGHRKPSIRTSHGSLSMKASTRENASMVSARY